MKYSLIVLCLLTIFILIFKIESSPPLLSQDEASFANASYNISQNLHDENNRFLPLYFETLSSKLTDWKNPFLVYWTAIFIKFFGFGIFSTRLSSLVLGLISVIFLYKTIKLLFPKDKYVAIVSSLFLITSPLFVIQSRIVIDPIALVPLTMAELYFLVSYYKNQKISTLISAAIFSGINFYTYSPARLFSGLILMIGVIILTQHKNLKIKESIFRIFISGFVFFLFILPTIIWQIRYPGLITNRYIDKLLPFNLENLISGYWVNYLRYFDFSFIFGNGDADLLHSTGRAGVFLFGAIPLFVFGIISLIKNYKDKINIFLLILLIIYPLGIFNLNEPYRACRTIYMLNIFPLIFAFGWMLLIKNYKKIAIACILILFIQSPIVLYDFYFKYPIRTQLSWKYRYQLATQIEKMLLDAHTNPENNYYIDEKIWFGIDNLIYYQNIHKIKPKNIAISKDIGKVIQNNSFILTNINGEGEEPEGSRILSGWEGYYIITKK
jgi:4-amino-4-deoxy-L-arabinose transferase-like glycosyltransferase